MRNLQRSAGFVLGPLAWTVNTELGQVLPHAECGTLIPTSALISVVAMALALLGAHLSWRVSRTRVSADPHYIEGRTSMRFLDQLGALVGLTFAFALALQSAAAFIVSPCER
jgi:hypothetical protein